MPNQNHKTPIDYLIVDNQAERRETVAKILGNDKQGQITSTVDARSAREILFSQQVGIVIAAAAMPKMTGIELLRLVRRIPRYLDLPFIIMLEEDDQENEVFAKEEGADYILTGAVTEASLQNAVAVVRKQILEQTGPQKALQEARTLFLQREYEEAIKKTLAIEGISQNHDALQLLCECYYRQKNYAKAVQYLKKTITTPTSRAMHLLSKVCLAENRCGDAITHLTKANLRYPTNLDLKIDLGKLYLSLGMEEQAKEQFDAVAEKNPSDLNLVKMGKTYLNRGKVKEATAFLDLAEEPIPETAYIFAELATALSKEGTLDDAARQYEKCLRLIPNNPAYLLNLSKLYLKTAHRDQAQSIIKQLHQRFPDDEKINNIFLYLQSH